MNIGILGRSFNLNNSPSVLIMDEVDQVQYYISSSAELRGEISIIILHICVGHGITLQIYCVLVN